MPRIAALPDGSTPRGHCPVGDQPATRYPGVELVGVESGPFRALTETEELELARRITDAGRRCGLGRARHAPAGSFVDRFRDLVPATLIAIGAAFDFHAGTKRQAPRVVQRFGFEWLFRLITEPRRLWKRYLIAMVVSCGQCCAADRG